MKLVCKSCGAHYAANEVRWRCDCGGLLDLDFVPKFDLGTISSRQPTMWRYREAIPIENDGNIVSFNEGFTPLVDMEIDGIPVKVKNDHLFPSGSYKDRGASVLISKAKELGIRHVVEDSSGNAGAAISTYCAKARIKCDIYVPDSASTAKLVQIEMMGARLFKISGSREDTAHAVLAAAENIYYASHSWNPFFFHGTKTVAYEMCEQLGWRAPDVIFTPVGNGTLLLGAAIGFAELFQIGIIEKTPRLVAVQAANCAPCAEAFFNGDLVPLHIEKKPTLAEGIAVAQPVRGAQIIQAVRDSHGDFVTVTEDDMAGWLRRLYHQGYYIEPTSAAVFAGLATYSSKLDKNQTIVTIITGHGLKAHKKV